MSTTAKSIQGTQTEQNLAISYLNEAQSYARYTFYAQQADKESYFPIGQIFRETADNELHHAKIFFKYLPGGNMTAPTPTDTGVIGDTATNLKISIDEEQKEGVDAYIRYAEIADQEGFGDIANHFRAIAAVEKHHMDRFKTLLQQVQTGTVWKRDKPIQWECLVCGYVYEGTEPPMPKCPGCDHPFQHYMPMDIR